MSHADFIKNYIKNKPADVTSGSHLTVSKDNMYKPVAGMMFFDILMYKVSQEGNPDNIKPGQYFYKRTYWTHANIGPEQKKIVCPHSIGKPCPVCEWLAMERRKEGVSYESIKSMMPSKRELYNVIDLTKQNPTIQVMDISNFAFGKRLETELSTTHDENIYRFADAIDGFSLEVLFEDRATGGGGKYPSVSSLHFLPRGFNYGEEIKDQTVDLDKLIQVLSYSDLEKMVLGDVEAEEIGEDAGPILPPPPAAVTRASVPRVAVGQPPAVARPVIARAAVPGVVQRPQVAAPAVQRTVAAPPVVTRPTISRAVSAPVVRAVPVATPISVPEPESEANLCPQGKTFGQDCNTAGCETCPDDTWRACQEAQGGIQ
jgi:hypothetical protein